jgi:hypothetical protein
MSYLEENNFNFVFIENVLPPQEQDYYGDTYIGSVLIEGGNAGADIWSYYHDEDDEMRLEFKGWRDDDYGSSWSVDCSINEKIEKTLKTVCMTAEGRIVEHVRMALISYSKDMPDQTITQEATINQRMDFPDQRWSDVRDQDQWYDVHMIVRCM